VFGLVFETGREVRDQLDRVLDTLAVLPDDPDHGGTGVSVIQLLQVRAQVFDDALVAVGVLPEYVPDYYHSFFDHKLSSHFGPYELVEA